MRNRNIQRNSVFIFVVDYNLFGLYIQIYRRDSEYICYSR